MTTPFWCVFAVFLLIWAPRVVVAMAQGKQPEGYDNKTPRDQQARLTGWGKRAQAAHQNTFEAFAPFAAAVFAAHLAHVDPTRNAVLACTFVAARVAYPIAYLTDLDKLRSGVWFVGFLANVGLFLLPAVP